jgi:hypothetical protein
MLLGALCVGKPCGFTYDRGTLALRIYEVT